MAFVADADGIGTTAVVAPSLDLFRPAFGPASRQRHLDAGAHEVDGVDVPTLRRDVDDRDDLVEALRARRRPAHVAGHDAARVSRVGAMQGTVSAYDADTHSGRVLLDDGVELPSRPRPSTAAGCGCCGPASGCGWRPPASGGSLRVVGLQILTLS